jgi:hypothetical protein
MSSVEISYRVPNHVPSPKFLSLSIPIQTLERPLSGILPPPEKHKWLNEYEQLEGSIFKYYNVENEVEFLKAIESLPDDKKDFYLQENVKRFLGEFVGKIPYTTIPYKVDDMGISYAGVYVRDSYQKATILGGEREKAEIKGFDEIESTYIQSHLKRQGEPPTGVWISPPKIADYGFVFIFAPDSRGNVKEYILRYPEAINELKKSKQIYSTLSPTLSPQNTDEFLTRPLFDKTNRDSKVILDSVMGQMGISQEDIQKSHQFENAVNSTLSEWIQSYNTLIKNLVIYEKDSPLYSIGVTMAKKKLLAIYQKAGEIKQSIDEEGNIQAEFMPTFFDVPLSIRDLNAYAATLQTQSKDLPTTSGGSCPALQETSNDPFGRPVPFMDSLTIITNLKNGLSVKKVMEKDTFTCPKCGYEIPAGKGFNFCPNCKITSQQYAEETGIKCV